LWIHDRRLSALKKRRGKAQKNIHLVPGGGNPKRERKEKRKKERNLGCRVIRRSSKTAFPLLKEGKKGVRGREGEIHMMQKMQGGTF